MKNFSNIAASCLHPIFEQTCSILFQPSVAIIILNFNGKDFLQKFLPSVLASSYSNKRIIVADNASTDDSTDLIKNNFKEAELILLEKNFGFAEGYNRALAKVDADYYVLLNSDVEVEANWIEPVIKIMEADKNIAACQPKLLSYHQKEMFEYAGAAGGFIDKLGYPFTRGRIFDTVENDEHQYDCSTEIFWACGAAMFTRAAVYKAMNGLDEYFFAHNEEIDLCWRMKRAGYKIFYCPSSVVYHVGGGTLPKGHKKTFLNFRNNLIMLCKNLPAKELMLKLPSRFFLDGAFAWKSLLSGDTSSFIAVLKAHFSLLNWMFSKKAKISLPKKNITSLEGVYNGSVVWQYFIRKKKYFSEIVDNNK